jgi:glycosyltransferase involved in cell wall biosynthesis
VPSSYREFRVSILTCAASIHAMNAESIRVTVIMESVLVSGPAKNLIEFARRSAEPEPGVPRVKFSLITYTRRNEVNDFIVAARQAGMPTYVLNEQRRFDTSVIGELKRVVREQSPDILQSHNIKSHFYVRLTGLHKHYPWIVFNHGYTEIDLKDRIFAQFDRWSVPAAKRVVAVCKPFAERLVRRGVDPSHIRVQHNSVKAFVPPPQEQVGAIRHQFGIRAEEQVILCVGRLSKEKGHRDLLHALSLLSQRPELPAYKVVLAGEGPERPALENLAAQFSLGGKLIFAGHQKEIRPFYAMAHLLVLPSHSEGSPNVLLEAMAAGLPVVATAVGGVPEIMQGDDVGFMVPPYEPSTMADAIASLLADDALRQRFGQAGLQKVTTEYTPEAYRRSMALFYQSVLNESKR